MIDTQDAERASSLHAGDARTASDALAFLQGFLQRFPSYQGRPFWIAGESYGGHYVPNLALEVVKFNDAADAGQRINIKGFLAGVAAEGDAKQNMPCRRLSQLSDAQARLALGFMRGCLPTWQVDARPPAIRADWCTPEAAAHTSMKAYAATSILISH